MSNQLRNSKYFRETQWVIKAIYITNNIEGEDITIDDTRAVITNFTKYNSNITEYKKALISDFYIAYKYIHETIYESLSVPWITFLHSIALTGTKPEIAGFFKTVNNTISSDRNVRFTPYQFVEEELMKLVEWYNSDTPTLERIAELKRLFIRIHPFEDGNGRISRMIVQRELCRIGEYPVTFINIKREEYSKIMSNAYYSQNSKEILSFIKEQLEMEKEPDAVNKALGMLKGLFKQ